MSVSLFKNEFKPIKLNTPKLIIKEQANLLYKMTNNEIIMKQENYNNDIFNLKNQQEINLHTYDSEKLKTGDIGKEFLTFIDEIYVTSIRIPKYKYRIFFMQYTIKPYPIKIILDTEIAEEIQSLENIKLQSEEEFLDLFSKILNSEKVTDVITSLLSFQ